MKISKICKNIWLNIVILWSSLFRGMKAADEKTMGVTKDGNVVDDSIEEHVSEESVYADLLKGELTQEVIALRDSNYRGYKKSFDYDYIGNGNVIKKEDSMLKTVLNVYNPENYPVKLIQDNRLIVEGMLEASQNAENEGDEVTNDNNLHELKIERDVFPRFLIENYAKKVVVRKREKDVLVDLYFSVYARQFRPTDSLFITELKNVYENRVKLTDTFIIDSIEFITNSCYGSKDIVLYVFGNLKFMSIDVYDGNFVVTYSGIPVCDGNDLTEQYRTKEMDEKYEKKEMRENTKFNFDAVIEKEEFDSEQAISLLKELNG